MSLSKETILIMGVASLGLVLVGIFGLINPINSSVISSNEIPFVITTVSGSASFVTVAFLAFLLRDLFFSDRDLSDAPPY